MITIQRMRWVLQHLTMTIFDSKIAKQINVYNSLWPINPLTITDTAAVSEPVLSKFVYNDGPCRAFNLTRYCATPQSTNSCIKGRDESFLVCERTNLTKIPLLSTVHLLKNYNLSSEDFLNEPHEFNFNFIRKLHAKTSFSIPSLQSHIIKKIYIFTMSFYQGIDGKS